MGEAAGAVIYYTLIILYAFFKLIVVFHAAKNKKNFLWILAVLIPGFDFYYYFKFVKTD
jgi:hypothetical protein